MKLGAVVNLTIEISDKEAAELKARAAAEGLTPEQWLKKLATQEKETGLSDKPFTSGYGMLAKYGPGPSADDIDENRREIFRGFAAEY